jgi:hypothetical protein
MTRQRSLLEAVVFAVAVAGLGAGPGCKSDDEDPTAAFIASYCDAYKPCCAAAGLPADGVACEALFASTRSPQAVYDPAAGGHCISGLQQIASQPGFCEGELLPPSSCAQAFGASAGTCIQDNDCPAPAEGDARCVSGFAEGVEVRKCQTQIRGGLDATPCVGSVRGGVTLYSGTSSGDVPDTGYLCDAAEGLRCDGTACVALKAAGDPCELSTDCADGAFCDANTGTCAARKAVGESCIDQALECADGAYCDAAAMVCAGQMDVGAACTDNGQCLTGNCPDGTCQAIPPVGANALCGG